EVEFGRLPLDGGDDRGPVVAGVAAPQRRCRVEDLAPLGRVVMHVLRARDEARAFLEGAVRREREPEGGEVVGNLRPRRGRGSGGGGHAGSLSASAFPGRWQPLLLLSSYRSPCVVSCPVAARHSPSKDGRSSGRPTERGRRGQRQPAAASTVARRGQPPES